MESGGTYNLFPPGTSSVVVERYCHFACAHFIIVCITSILVYRAHSNGVNAGGIAISSTRVMFVSSISCCPDIDGTLPIPTLNIGGREYGSLSLLYLLLKV